MNRYFEKENQASLYRLYCPKTPDFIVCDIIRYVEEKRPSPLRLAVDVGCGSGQNSFPMANYFDSVIGTDISRAQVSEVECERALPNSNVKFALASAYDMSGVVADHSADLVIGAMCVHWFDLPKFYAEVRRILAPNGVVAAIGYVIWELCHPTDLDRTERLSKLVRAFERSLIPDMNLNPIPKMDDLKHFYTHLQPFPFDDQTRIEVEPQMMQRALSHYLGTMMIWPTFQKLAEDNPEEAIAIMESFKKSILSIYGYDESMDPDKAVVYIPYHYYYVMGRVRLLVP